MIRNLWFVMFKTVPFLLPSIFFARKRVQQELVLLKNLSTDFEMSARVKGRLERFGFYCHLIQRAFFFIQKQKPTDLEQRRAVYFGFCTVLLDDLMDELGYNERMISELRQEEFSAYQHPEAFFLSRSYLFLKQSGVKDLSMFEKYFQKVLTAQLESEKQKDLLISKEEVERITCEKGGFSFLLLRACSDSALERGEADLMFEFGASVQYFNDVFDFYKDRKDGIRTLATISSGAGEMVGHFWDFNRKFFSALDETKVEKGKKEKLSWFYRFFSGTTALCLEQYKMVEHDRGTLALETVPRKELICDMEKPGNMLSFLKILLKMPAEMKG